MPQDPSQRPKKRTKNLLLKNLLQKKKSPPPPTISVGPTMRMIVADLLMVDGDFYVVRSERGEIRIEATPDTKITEKFDFGDRIKAKVFPNDKAMSIVRATPEDQIGVHPLEPSPMVSKQPTEQTQSASESPVKASPSVGSPPPRKGTRNDCGRGFNDRWRFYHRTRRKR